MASRPGSSDVPSDSSFPEFDHRFRDMRDKMNRDREAFFSDSPSPGFFGRESPFFSRPQTRPGFDEFRTSMGFPEKMESSARKTSAPPSSSSSQDHQDSIPIRVFHERQPPAAPGHEKHKFTSSRTADLPKSPAEPSTGSPRVTRAHSEPPKTFNQRLLKTKIPLGNVSEQNEHNLSTSASDSSVPHNTEKKPSKSSESEQPKSHHNEPTIRHIPIRVEGREEPVLNTSLNSSNDQASFAKKPSDFYPSKVKVERRAQHPPTTLKVNEKRDPAQEPTSPLSPIPSDQPIPMGYTETDNAKDNGAKKEEEPTSPQPMPAGPIPMPCSPDYMNKASQQQKEAEKANKVVDEKKHPCLQKLDKIMDDVRNLEKQLEAFKGAKNSKEYRFLDEMLTRNLLALDGIETEGRDDIRQQRKESIKSINRCLSILESKAKNQAEANNEILSDLAAQSNQQGKK